ncbi:hypothetical protein BRD17_03705 [Halobacteriales archaeon SW_7_68_16]|nr:MAG: hypothetical protein BRD17_03705 [Halobacteriales archaeon SW_7_68_16]
MSDGLDVAVVAFLVPAVAVGTVGAAIVVSAVRPDHARRYALGVLGAWVAWGTPMAAVRIGVRPLVLAATVPVALLVPIAHVSLLNDTYDWERLRLSLVYAGPGIVTVARLFLRV